MTSHAHTHISAQPQHPAALLLEAGPLCSQRHTHTQAAEKPGSFDSSNPRWAAALKTTSCVHDNPSRAAVVSTPHRIIELFGLEGTFRGHLAQPPCSEQGHLQPDQAAQSPVQPGLECFQGWGLHCFSGQPVPVLHHTRGKKFLAYIKSKSTLS